MDLLNSLVVRRSDKIKLSEFYPKYIEILGLIKASENLSNDFNNLNILKEKKELLSKIIPNAIMVISAVELILNNPSKNELLKKDLENIEKEFIKEITTYILNNNELKTVKDEIDLNQKIKEINENEEYSENIDLLFDYIKDSYEKGFLTIEEVVELNIGVAQKSVSPYQEKIKEITPSENEENILSDLSSIFKKYGYNFESLEREVIEKLNTFADISYIDFILKSLKEHNLTQKQLEALQKRLYDIITFKDKETFSKMISFIDENECSIVPIIMWFPGAFHKEVFRTSISNTSARSNNQTDGTLIIPGSYDKFIQNCELLKEMLGKEKLSDTDFARREKFINTSPKLIQKNLRILRSYGIIKEDEYPDAIVSLIGTHTAYHLDRFIETGNYEYIVNNLSYVSAPKNPLRFYKLRRAADLGEVITRGRGIKSEIMQDQYEYMGILETDENGEKKVVQRTHIDEEKNQKLIDEIPKSNLRPYGAKKENPREIKKAIYSFNYYFRMYNAFKSFNVYNEEIDVAQKEDLSLEETLKLSPSHERNAAIANLIQKAFDSESEEEIYIDPNIFNDGFVKHLDSRFQSINKHNYDVKKDDCTYEFRFNELEVDNYNRDNLIIRISRYKVLRTITLLKKHHLWIDQNNYSLGEMISIIISVFIRDSIISQGEKAKLISLIKYYFKNYLKDNYFDTQLDRGGYYA